MTYALDGLLTGLAARYSPDRLQFVLADYRGGAMSARFANFPHTAVSIPSLNDDSDGLATLCDIIESELDRRAKQIIGECVALYPIF